MRKAILLMTAVILISSVGCVSTKRRYQEVDDVYVTESDRASERAEELAQQELAGEPEKKDQTPDSEEVEDEQVPNNRQERQNRRSNTSSGGRVLLYVLGGLIEIAFNILLIWLFY